MGVSNRSHSRGEIDRGVALITVMLVMLALLGLGITALWITSGNLKIVATTSLRTQALYVAEAGIEAVRSDLNGAAPRDLTRLLVGDRDPLDDLPTGRGVDDSGQPNGVGAIYTYVDGTRLRDVAFPPARFQRGSAGTAESPVSTTMGTYTVWIRNDTGELRQGKITMDGNGSVVVRSRGVAVDGRTAVVLEVTLGGWLTGTPIVDSCTSGKNACDENSSTLSNVFVE